LYKYFRSINFK